MNDALLRENYVYVVFEADTLFHSLKKYFIYNNSSDSVAIWHKPLHLQLHALKMVVRRLNLKIWHKVALLTWHSLNL